MAPADPARGLREDRRDDDGDRGRSQLAAVWLGAVARGVAGQVAGLAARGARYSRDAAAAVRSAPAQARQLARAYVAQLRERPVKLLVLPAAALCLAMSIAGTSAATSKRQGNPTAAAPDPLFQGSRVPGRAGAEQSAIALVQRLGGIPLGATSIAQPLVDPAMATAGACATSRLAVSWSPPVGSYRIGAYVDPLGPPPTPDTQRVNGVVLCQGSTYAYVGFEASWNGTRWQLNAVPNSSEEDVNRPSSPAEATAPAATPALPENPANPNPTVALTPGAFVVADAGWGAAIEPLAPYDPQTQCDPTPKPGAVGLRNLLLHSFSGSSDLGIGQSCDTPDGVSEHKEGRAFDWGVSVDNPAEKAMADQFLTWVLAPDSHGNAYAMIRRLGIMYMIWDHHIWGSYRAEDGWRPYEGVSPHTDHIHISLSWAGALAQTSFWTGHVGNISAITAPPGTAAPPSQSGPKPGPGNSGPSGPQSPPPSQPGAVPSRSGTAGSPSPSSPTPLSPSGSHPSSSPPSSSPSSTTTTTTAPGPAPGIPPPTLPVPLPH